MVEISGCILLDNLNIPPRSCACYAYRSMHMRLQSDMVCGAMMEDSIMLKPAPRCCALINVVPGQRYEVVKLTVIDDRIMFKAPFVRSLPPLPPPLSCACAECCVCGICMPYLKKNRHGEWGRL